MRIVVIGSIAAGVSAAAKLSAGAQSAQVVVYEKSAFYSCGACGLPYYLNQSLEELSAAITGKEDELAAQHIEAHLSHEVVSIHAAARKLQVRDLTANRVFTDSYDKLIIATGSRSLVPQVPGNNRVGVQTFKSVEDLLFLKEFTRTPYVRDICILGGSYAGLEMAKAFLKLGRNVRIIEKERKLLPAFDTEVSTLIQKELEANGVQFSLGETVTAFPGQTFIEAVQTNRGKYPCDLCIVCIGVTPNTGLLAGTGVVLDGRGAVIINEKLETNVPGIYAVGDCAQCSCAGQRTSSIKTAGLEIARTGLTEEEARKAGRRVRSVIATGNDRPGICPHPNRVTIKLVYEEGSRKVLGAQVWGRKNASARANAIAVAVAAGMTVDQVDLVYSGSGCSIWDPIQVVCNAAR